MLAPELPQLTAPMAAWTTKFVNRACSQAILRSRAVRLAVLCHACIDDRTRHTSPCAVAHVLRVCTLACTDMPHPAHPHERCTTYRACVCHGIAHSFCRFHKNYEKCTLLMALSGLAPFPAPSRSVSLHVFAAQPSSWQLSCSTLTAALLSTHCPLNTIFCNK